MALLEIANLSVEFETAAGMFKAVDGVDMSMDAGESLAIVGESGSGKSVLMLALLGLVPWPGRVRAERIEFAGRDLKSLNGAERRKIIGKEIAMIFQAPQSALNPCYTVGFQIVEALSARGEGRARKNRDRAIELMEQVGISDPAIRLQAYPHQLSGGMCQRVMIAMAMACNPRLLIADEPTTALDVTVQAQVLDLLASLRGQRDMALILITHDMGVVAESADTVSVMYAGQKVEMQSVSGIFEAPRHPYTAALIDSMPERHPGERKLWAIPGAIAGANARHKGCRFEPRCRYAKAICRNSVPCLQADSATRATVRCHFPI